MKVTEKISKSIVGRHYQADLEGMSVVVSDTDMMGDIIVFHKDELQEVIELLQKAKELMK